MALRVENGVRTYEAVEGWGELKPGWIWGQVGDVAVDSNDRVHVFTRNANPPYRIYDISGKLLHSWGHGLFEDAHGICIGPDDMVYLTDRGPQLVMKFTNDGRHLFTIGERYQHSDTGYTDESPTVKQAAPPFHHPTNVGLRPNGEFYRLRWLSQCARPQVRGRWHVALLLGRTRRRPRSIQPGPPRDRA